MSPSSTNSENNNPSEFLAENNVGLRRILTSGIIGLTNGMAYNPSESNRSPLAPTGLQFATTGVSNGYLMGVSGITDFVAYNPYIHHYAVSAGGAISSALNNAGVRNVGSSITTVNVMPNLVMATQRFQIYTRRFRG